MGVDGSGNGLMHPLQQAIAWVYAEILYPEKQASLRYEISLIFMLSSLNTFASINNILLLCNINCFITFVVECLSQMIYWLGVPARYRWHDCMAIHFSHVSESNLLQTTPCDIHSTTQRWLLMMPWIRSVDFPHFVVQSIDAVPSRDSEMKIDHCTNMRGANMEIIIPWNRSLLTTCISVNLLEPVFLRITIDRANVVMILSNLWCDARAYITFFCDYLQTV